MRLTVSGALISFAIRVMAANSPSHAGALSPLNCGEYEFKGRLLTVSPGTEAIELNPGTPEARRLLLRDLKPQSTLGYGDRFVRIRAAIRENVGSGAEAQASVIEFQGSVTERNALQEAVKLLEAKDCQAKKGR